MIVLLSCFLLGTLAGFIFAFIGEPSAELYSYLNDYFELAAQGNLELSFLSVAWDCIRWPLAVVVFGFTALGVGVIPAMFLVRGFLLSYTATLLGVLFGKDGAAVAAVLFAVTVLLVIPTLFVVGCESFRASLARLPKAAVPADGRWRPEILLPGIGVLAIAVALQWTVTPMMLSAVCARLFT